MPLNPLNFLYFFIWLNLSAAALNFLYLNNHFICNLQCTDATMCHQIIQIRIQRKYTAQYNMHWTEKPPRV